ncbi:MAG: Na+/H+ antiporter subunit E [Chlamydiia bacterium]|nr:Na+/H+ antiporter subunit E [Chlamydiia bacterium]
MLFAFPVFVLSFIIAFIRSSLSVAYTVYCTPAASIQAHIVTYDGSDLSWSERLILAQLVTLTPGTIVVGISKERPELRIHVLDGSSQDEVKRCIDESLAKQLKGVTRC